MKDYDQSFFFSLSGTAGWRGDRGSGPVAPP